MLLCWVEHRGLAPSTTAPTLTRTDLTGKPAWTQTSVLDAAGGFVRKLAVGLGAQAAARVLVDGSIGVRVVGVQHSCMTPVTFPVSGAWPPP